MWLLNGTKPSANQVSGSPFQREVAAAPGRSLSTFVSRKDPENPNKLGMQMQKSEKLFSLVINHLQFLQLTAVRILTCYGVGTDQYL